MRLLRKKSIELTIELWTWLAKTGKYKSDWPKWEKYERVSGYCFLCEYDKQQQKRYKDKYRDGCYYCPLVTSDVVTKGVGVSCYSTYYWNWCEAKTPQARKKYAKLFSEQLRTLKKDK